MLGLAKIGHVLGQRLMFGSLAMVEMKTLLRAVYSTFETSVAPEMKGDMTIDDQIIASRPKDQTCLLNFVYASRTR